MDDEDWHGKIGGYTNHRCRCERCRAANTQRQRDLRSGRSGRQVIPHGTDNGYTNYGCRCQSCRQARARAKKRERESK
jgi:hypothetical protein